MTTDWKPRAPSARKAFQQTNKEKTTDKSASHGAVTKNELTKLEAQREKPKEGRVLAPGGAGQRASEVAQQQREERIKHTQSRLRRMKNRARDDFDRSR